MKNLLLVCACIFLITAVFSQNKVNLMPDSMICYVGQLTRPEFEKLTGSETGVGKDGEVFYLVRNTYDEEVTVLRCLYRQADQKLGSVEFSTPRYFNYWLAFSYLEGYEGERDCKARKNRKGEITRVDLCHSGLKCRISGVRRLNPQLTMAVVTYKAVGL